jgi:hypothetical protein
MCVLALGQLAVGCWWATASLLACLAVACIRLLLGVIVAAAAAMLLQCTCAIVIRYLLARAWWAVWVRTYVPLVGPSEDVQCMAFFRASV